MSLTKYSPLFPFIFYLLSLIPNNHKNPLTFFSLSFYFHSFNNLSYYLSFYFLFLFKHTLNAISVLSAHQRHPMIMMDSKLYFITNFQTLFMLSTSTINLNYSL